VYPALATNGENRHDVGVEELRRRLSLDVEPLELLGVGHRGERQDLQRHAAVERELSRLVDDAHDTTADLTQQMEVAKHAHPRACLTRGGRVYGGVGGRGAP
jgi:hypothetical protein